MISRNIRKAKGQVDVYSIESEKELGLGFKMKPSGFFLTEQ